SWPGDECSGRSRTTPRRVPARAPLGYQTTTHVRTGPYVRRKGKGCTYRRVDPKSGHNNRLSILREARRARVISGLFCPSAVAKRFRFVFFLPKRPDTSIMKLEQSRV